jgi:site-specific DNA recombinase
LWSQLFPAEQARVIQLLVERVDISTWGADLTLRVEGLTTLLQNLRTAAGNRKVA